MSLTELDLKIFLIQFFGSTHHTSDSHNTYTLSTLCCQFLLACSY